MIWMYIIIMILLWILIYLVTEDFVNPASISVIIWLMVYIMLIFTRGVQELIDGYELFAIAGVCFEIGFILTYPKRKCQNYLINYYATWNPDGRRLLTSINYICAIVWLGVSYKYISSPSSLWVGIRDAVGESDALQSGVSGVFQNVVIVYFIVSFAYYIIDKNTINRKNLILSLPPLIMVMLLSSRGVWYFLIITVVVMWIILKNESNTKVLMVALTGIVLFIIIFIVSSFQKYALAYAGFSMSNRLKLIFQSYFTAPPVAFVEWFNSSPRLYHGAYVFRFIMAILNRIGFDVQVVDTIQKFTYVDGVATNVYTSLHWYASDFGVVSIVLVEISLGLFFGLLYRKARLRTRPSIMAIIAYSMFTFTIVIQFFYDQFFAIASVWIQRIIILYLFTNTRLSIIEEQL